MTTDEPIVLIVDDSDHDALLMRIVFERAGFVRPLRFARDGEEAIAYLQGGGAYRNRQHFPLPTVVLLDLNMPRKNGFDVLDWIRRQPGLKRLRVYILSASRREEDIQRAYDLGANSYLVKPGSLDELTHLATTLIAWLKLCHFAPLGEVTEVRDRATVNGGNARSDAANVIVEPVSRQYSPPG